MKPKVVPLQERFAQEMAQIKPFPPFAVAVSGGADSMALMVLLAEWSQTNNLEPPSVITVNHGLRPEAATEASQVAKWSAQYGLNHKTMLWQHTTEHLPKSNIQAQARTARYELLYNHCKEQKIRSLMTAHTSDDQAETVLLRLARGSGLEGLAGMRPRQPLPVVHTQDECIELIRPLLKFSGDELRQFLQSKEQDWITDPSNFDLRYARVRTRQVLKKLDELNISAAKLAATAYNLQRATDALLTYADDLQKQAVEFYPEGYAYLDFTKLTNAPNETAFRVLGNVLKSIGGRRYRPRFDRLQRLFDQMETNPLIKDWTLSGCHIQYQAHESRFLIVRELGRKTANPQQALDLTLADQTLVWDNRFSLKITGGSQKTIGEKTVLSFLGEDGARLVETITNAASQTGLNNAPDFLTRWHAIPSLVRPTLPAVWQGQDLIALPHLSGKSVLLGNKEPNENEMRFFVQFLN